MIDRIVLLDFLVIAAICLTVATQLARDLAWKVSFFAALWFTVGLIIGLLLFR